MNWDYLRTNARPKALKHLGPPWAALPYSTIEFTRLPGTLAQPRRHGCPLGLSIHSTSAASDATRGQSTPS
jgi:hypothetical protein